MIKKSIKKVIEWASVERPNGYIQELRDNCSAWNEEEDYYLITEEAWNSLAEMYGGYKKEVAEILLHPKDRCQYRTCGGCAGGPQCTAKGMDCPYSAGTYEQCELWRKTQADCKERQKANEALAEFRQRCSGYQKIKGCKCELAKKTPCQQNKLPVDQLKCEKGWFSLSSQDSEFRNQYSK
jgi:hypothetical protein